MEFNVQVKKLHPEASLPRRTRPDDAAFDLRCLEDFTLHPGERKTVATGIAMAFPVGVAGLVTPRSGLAAHSGLIVVNTPGLIDPSYRGEVKVVLQNLDKETSFSAAKGDRIAQLLLVPYFNVTLVERQELPPSGDTRGEAGFGSSGVS